MGEVSWHEWNDHKQGTVIRAAYGVYAIPTFFIITSNGKIEKKCIGVDSLMKNLKEYISTEEVNKLINN